jgi:hypothetical protein
MSAVANAKQTRNSYELVKPQTRIIPVRHSVRPWKTGQTDELHFSEDVLIGNRLVQTLLRAPAVDGCEALHVGVRFEAKNGSARTSSTSSRRHKEFQTK